MGTKYLAPRLSYVIAMFARTFFEAINAEKHQLSLFIG